MKTTIKQRRFLKGINSLMEHRGARNIGREEIARDGEMEWEIDTPFGRMTVHPLTSGVRGYLGWVACRFDHSEQARKYLNCGPSGKWNQHYYTGYEPAAAVESFARALDFINTAGGWMLEDCRQPKTLASMDQERYGHTAAWNKPEVSAVQ